MQQFSDRRTINAEKLKTFIEVIGHHKSEDWIDLQGRIDLIDACFDPFGADRCGSIDEPELPACGTQKTRCQQERIRMIIDRGACGNGNTCQRNSEFCQTYRAALRGLA